MTTRFCCLIIFAPAKRFANDSNLLGLKREDLMLGDSVYLQFDLLFRVEKMAEVRKRYHPQEIVPRGLL